MSITSTDVPDALARQRDVLGHLDRVRLLTEALPGLPPITYSVAHYGVTCYLYGSDDRHLRAGVDAVATFAGLPPARDHGVLAGDLQVEDVVHYTTTADDGSMAVFARMSADYYADWLDQRDLGTVEVAS